MFLSLHDHHKAYLWIKLIDAGYMFANNKSKFAHHFTEEGHAFGSMSDIMDVVQIACKVRMLDTLERFYIYRETKLGIQINDKLTVQSNPIFEALLQNDPPTGH